MQVTETKRRRPLWGLAAVALLLCACGAEVVHDYPQPGRPRGEQYAPRQGIFGPQGLQLFGGADAADEDRGGGGMAVNSFLWRASLETLAFMPLASADSFGGVIITDWYSPPETPDERFKATVYILDRRLRADGLKVAVFRQRRGGAGWVDAAVDDDTATGVENAILTRARELRIAALPRDEG